MSVSDRCKAEDGVALFYALLVALVVGGVIVVTFATALSETRQSAFELDFEDTVHLAETGGEAFLQELTANATANSGIAGPAPAQSAYDWAIQESTRQTVPGTYDLPAVEGVEGDAVPIRPVGSDAQFVYGVGFTPSRDAFVSGLDTAYARVVRFQIGFSPQIFDGEFALLAGGNLDLGGNFKVLGSNGSVHTNGELKIAGSSGEASQGITHTGDCSGTCSGTPDAPVSGPVSTITIEQVLIDEIWREGNSDVVASQNDWYDYCAGVWRQRDVDDENPCEGPTTSAPAGWSGTNFDGNNGTADGVFYFPNPADNIGIIRPTGNMTVLAAGDIDVGPSANNDPLAPRLPGWLFVAEGDIEIGGNAATIASDPEAIVYAGGSIELDGTIESVGLAYVAFDSFNIGTSYQGGGNGSITYNGTATPPTGGDGEPFVIEWDEVR